jgi:hypothetical protein
MSTGGVGSGDTNKSHVEFYFMGKHTCILCEQIRTVNISELVEYYATVDDSVMDSVGDAVMYHLGIKDKLKYGDMTTRTALDRIEFLIESIVNDRVKKLVPTKASNHDIDDMMVRIVDRFENLYSQTVQESIKESVYVYDGEEIKENKENTDKSESTAVDKFYARYPHITNTKGKGTSPEKKSVKYNTKNTNSTGVKEVPADDKYINSKKSSVPVETTVLKDKSGRKEFKNWTRESMQEFLNDFENMKTPEVCKKWGYNNNKTCRNMKYYVEKKLKEY